MIPDLKIFESVKDFQAFKIVEALRDIEDGN